MVLSALTSILQGLSPPGKCGDCWYNSPERHAAEMVIFTTVFVSLAVFTILGGKKRTVEPNEPGFGRSPGPIILLMGVVMMGVCLETFYLKWKRGGKAPLLMFQPCNVLGFVWPYCCLINSKSSRVIFNTALFHILWPLMAMAAPDFTPQAAEGHGQPYSSLEVNVFWAHHVMLLVTPACVLLFNHIPRERDIWSYVYYYKLAICAAGLYATIVMVPLSLSTGMNIMYQLHPPDSVSAIIPESLHCYYRPGGVLLLCIVSAVSGFGFLYLVDLVGKVMVINKTKGE